MPGLEGEPGEQGPKGLQGEQGAQGIECTKCFKHFIGELYGGGILICVWKIDGNEHGLIASLTDLQYSIWSNVGDKLIGASAQSPSNGFTNTQAIISQPGHTNSAALICATYNYGGFLDWYLSSLFE